MFLWYRGILLSSVARLTQGVGQGEVHAGHKAGFQLCSGKHKALARDNLSPFVKAAAGVV